MKAVTRQRPKNANYSVSSNPTHTNGAPLKAKPRHSKPEERSQRPKDPAKQPMLEGDGGKMTNFRSLDDIPDFTDDFGSDKSNIKKVDSPYGKLDPVDKESFVSSPRYKNSPTKGQHVANPPQRNRKDIVNRSPPSSLRGPPPPLPAENLDIQNKQKHMEYPSSLMGNNAHDTNSCASVDTDFSDEDEEEDDCNNSYFSSTDDYHIDYTPGKRNNNVRMFILC